MLALVDLVDPLPFSYPAGVDPNPNFTWVVGNIVAGNAASPDPILGFGADLGWTGKGQHNRWIGNTFATSNTGRMFVPDKSEAEPIGQQADVPR